MRCVRELLPWGGHHFYDRFVGRSLIRFYQQQADAFPPGRVLDIGCGPGHLAELLRSMGRDVVGVDKDPQQVRIARRNHPELDVREGAAEALEFDDDSFDVVVTSESFHHWSDPEGGLQEARRVLRPGGTFVVMETCGDITKDEFRSWGRWIPPGWIHVIRWVFSVHGYTTERMQRELKPQLQARFNDVDVQRVDGWWVATGLKR